MPGSEESLKCKYDIGQSLLTNISTISICCLSVLCSFFILFSYIYQKRKGNSVSRIRLLFYTNIYGLIYAIVLIIEVIMHFFNFSIPGLLCEIFSFLKLSCILGMESWSLSFSIHLVISVFTHLNYDILRRVFIMFEVIFFVISFGVIPFPLFLLVFIKLPIGKTRDYVSIFGEATTGFCLFDALNLDPNLSFIIEIVVFYVPLTFLFLLNLVVYIMLFIRMCTSKKSYKLMDKMNHRNYPTNNSINYVQSNKKKSNSLEPNKKNEEIYSQQYRKYLKRRSIQSLIYLSFTFLNWGFWITIRFLWEFINCSGTLRILFFFFNLVLCLVGPRLDCILISILYGSLETVKVPVRIKELLSEKTSVHFFKEYCESLGGKFLNVNVGGDFIEMDNVNLIFFYFDIEKIRSLMRRNDENNIEINSQILRLMQLIINNYLSESGPFHLPSNEIMNNNKRNCLKKLVANLDIDDEETRQLTTDGMIKERIDEVCKYLYPVQEESLEILNILVNDFKKSDSYSQCLHALRLNQNFQKSNLFTDVFLGCWECLSKKKKNERDEQEIFSYISKEKKRRRTLSHNNVE